MTPKCDYIVKSNGARVWRCGKDVDTGKSHRYGSGLRVAYCEQHLKIWLGR